MDPYSGGQSTHLHTPAPNGFHTPTSLHTRDHQAMGTPGTQWPANGQVQGIRPPSIVSLGSTTQQPINNPYAPSVGQLGPTTAPAGHATYPQVHLPTQQHRDTDINIQTQNALRMGLGQYPPTREDTPTFSATSYTHYNQSGKFVTRSSTELKT